jgi:protein phosphatase
VRLVAGGATDRGRVRDGNEDAYLLEPSLSLFAVADGMGGHRGGEVASATAVATLRARVREGVALPDAVRAANEAVLARAAADPELRGMGTTLTAALGDGSGLTLAHVGDSRAYLWRDGALHQVTADHSLVADLVREGQITAAEATVHPYRSVVTRALGVEDDLEVDMVPLALAPGDRVLLCSDGLPTMVPDDRIAAVLAAEADPTRAANTLVDLANEAGGEDNVTVVVIDAVDDDPLTRPLGAAASGPAPGEPAPPPIPPSAPARGGPAPTPPAGPAGDRSPRALRLVARSVWVAVPVLVILGFAVAATAYYARRTYFVAFDRAERVTIYQGRPGGLLWWDATVRERTGLRRGELTEAAATQVERAPSFARLGDAVAFVGRLDRRSPPAALTPAPTSPTTGPPAPPAPGPVPGPTR